MEEVEPGGRRLIVYLDQNYLSYVTLSLIHI